MPLSNDDYDRHSTYFGVYSASQAACVSKLLRSLGVRFEFIREEQDEERLKAWTAWEPTASNPREGHELFIHDGDVDKVGAKIVDMYPERKFDEVEHCAPAKRSVPPSLAIGMSISEITKLHAAKWMPAAPASEDSIRRLVGEVGFELPPDYLEFLRLSNGGSGNIPVQPWSFDSLWTAEELLSCNRDYEVAEYCPAFFGIGSSGGGEMFAFDMRSTQPWPVVVVPFIGMEAEAALPVAADFRSFVAMFGQKGSHGT